MVVEANWYSCNVKVISRSGTRTAIGAAAYATGTCLYDRELEASPNYEPSDFRRKGGVEQWFISARDSTPEWTYDIESLCNEAQAHDTRKNSCTMRTGRFSLPHWADAEGREHITREVAGYLVERYGVAVIAAIHAPDSQGDDRNWHAHLVFTTRQMDENGFGAKTRALDDKKTGPQEIIHIREAVATIINDYMEEAGADERVDHRSYKDRDIERTPTIHMGSAANALERKGIRTERGDRNRAIRERNRRVDELVQEIGELHAEISAELAREFTDIETEPDIRSQEPETEIEEPQPEREEPEGGRKEKRPLEAQAESHSAFTSDITRAYMERGAETPEEERERSERRWYEEVYSRAVETVQHYWSKFVDRITSRREERDREDYEPER